LLPKITVTAQIYPKWIFVGAANSEIMLRRRKDRRSRVIENLLAKPAIDEEAHDVAQIGLLLFEYSGAPTWSDWSNC